LAVPRLRALLLALCLALASSLVWGGSEALVRRGGRALKTPLGTFYTPNITPDPKYGIGRWSDADFVRALTEGKNPSGQNYYPAFPYASYTHMRREDILALWAYLSTVTPVARPNKPHELVWYVRWRPLVRIWKRLFFAPGEFRPDPQRSQNWNRGAYLVTALGHCGECHTPRNAFGAADQRLAYAGTRRGPDGAAIPNITPDRKTGIGRWSESDLTDYLETGARPDGDYAGSLMADVIDDGLRYLSKSDIRAIATFLRSLPPVDHAIERKRKAKPGPYD
jgi:mono/diheme cytochrome c family protein